MSFFSQTFSPVNQLGGDIVSCQFQVHNHLLGPPIKHLLHGTHASMVGDGISIKHPRTKTSILFVLEKYQDSIIRS